MHYSVEEMTSEISDRKLWHVSWAELETVVMIQTIGRTRDQEPGQSETNVIADLKTALHYENSIHFQVHQIQTKDQVNLIQYQGTRHKETFPMARQETWSLETTATRVGINNKCYCWTLSFQISATLSAQEIQMSVFQSVRQIVMSLFSNFEDVVKHNWESLLFKGTL